MAPRAQKITGRTRELLAAAQIDGLHVRLTEQVTPAEYKQVKAVLESLGGVWTRKVQALVFPAGTDPAALIAQTLNGGAVPLHARAAEGFVRTPDELADTIARYPYANVGNLPAGALVLEPSAGDGSIVAAILRANPSARVYAIEPNTQRANPIRDLTGDVVVEESTLEESRLVAGHLRWEFDVVVMNPPFAVPGNATLWIDHVRAALDLLKPGGRLVAIVPGSFAHRSDKKHTAIRELVDSLGGWDELPEDAFKESGTGVRTCVIWMDKPVEDVAQVDTGDAAELGDRDALHDADGNHIGTARTAHGCDLERHEAAMRAHLEAHRTGAVPPHEPTDAAEPAGLRVYPLDLCAGIVATVTGVDWRGIDYTMTGRLLTDPERVEHDGRDLVRVRLRNRTGADVELYAEEGSRVTLPDLEPDTEDDRVAVCYERYLPPQGGLQGTYRTSTRKVTRRELAALGEDDRVRIIAKVSPLRGADDAPAPANNGATVVGRASDGRPVIVAHVSRVDLGTPVEPAGPALKPATDGALFAL